MPDYKTAAGIDKTTPEKSPAGRSAPMWVLFLLPAAAWRTIPVQIVAKQLQGSKFSMGQKYACRSCLTRVFKTYAKQLQEAYFCQMRDFDPCSCLARVCVGICHQAAAGSKKSTQMGCRPAGGRGLGLRKCVPFSSEGKNSKVTARNALFSSSEARLREIGFPQMYVFLERALRF